MAVTEDLGQGPRRSGDGSLQGDWSVVGLAALLLQVGLRIVIRGAKGGGWTQLTWSRLMQRTIQTWVMAHTILSLLFKTKLKVVQVHLDNFVSLLRWRCGMIWERAGGGTWVKSECTFAISFWCCLTSQNTYAKGSFSRLPLLMMCFHFLFQLQEDLENDGCCAAASSTRLRACTQRDFTSQTLHTAPSLLPSFSSFASQMPRPCTTRALCASWSRCRQSHSHRPRDAPTHVVYVSTVSAVPQYNFVRVSISTCICGSFLASS